MNFWLEYVVGQYDQVKTINCGSEISYVGSLGTVMMKWKSLENSTRISI